MIIRYLKLKPLSWFEENCYYDAETSDKDTYYWLSRQAYGDWLNADNSRDFSPAMQIVDIHRGFSKWASNYGSTFKEYSWAMEYELTIEDYPELYI